MNDELYEGLLIRYWLDGNNLVLVLEDYQDGFPPNLAEQVREITIQDINERGLNLDGIKKSQGDDLWLIMKNDSVTIGANFMLEQEIEASGIVVTKRPHNSDDLRALYALLRSAVVEYQRIYGLECQKRANLEAGLKKFITTRHDRVVAKLDFFSEKDPVKAAGYKGMLTLLDELANEFKL